MSHDRFEELVIAHAVDGVLDAQGARDLIAHLGSCDECRILLRNLEAASSDLALAAIPITPPAGLEQRILDGARSTASARTRMRGRRRRLLVVAAALAAVALGATSVSLYSSLERERRDARVFAVALDAIGDPSARIARLTTPDGRGNGVLALGNAGGVLVIDGLAPTPAGKVHELWLIDDGRPRAVDVFTVRGGRTIVAFGARGEQAADAAAVTLEDGPLGSPVPTGDMLLTGVLSSPIAGR